MSDLGELENLVEDKTVVTTDDSQPGTQDDNQQTDTITGDKKDETPPVSEPKKPEPEMVPLAKAQAEKGRRKEVERENDALRAQIKEQSTEQPDAYMEPDKAIKHAVDEVRSEMMSTFRNVSEANARRNHTDYEDMFDLFKDLAAKQPHLIGQMQSEFDPGEFVYQTAFKHKQLESLGNITDVTKELETLRVENAELKKTADPAQETAPPPPDLTTARSTGGDPDSGLAEGNDGLEQLLDATRR